MIMMKYDVFISYSRKDAALVNIFVQRLETEGLRVWIDRDGVESGDAFKKVIVNAIKESAIFVFFSSESSNRSPWTTKEVSIAVHYGKPIIPIRLDKSVYSEDIEFDLVNLDYIDYSEEEMRQLMMDKLIRTIKAKVLKQEPEMSEQTKMTYEQPANPIPNQNAGFSSRSSEEKSRQSPNQTKGKKGLWIGLGAVVLLALLFFAFKDKIMGPSDDGSSGFDDLVISANGVSFTVKPVEGGTFTMVDTDGNFFPAVTLNDYYLGETEVTQALWKAVMGKVPTYQGGWNTDVGLGDLYPAYKVSWNDIKTFIVQLNGMTGKNFRLPTEAEWEYAARGGKKTNNYIFAGSNHVDKVAWYNQNSDKKAHEVKIKQPNELGLYDMSGNLWEWCSDVYVEAGVPTAAKGEMRVLRGGGWNRNADRCKVNYRGSGGPDFRGSSHGFRLALTK